DLDLTVRGVVFAAAGTAGQRCTTMRRVIAQSSVVDELTDRLSAAYERLPIGNPLAQGTLVGPLIGEQAYAGMRSALDQAERAGGRLVVGGVRRHTDAAPEAYYAEPALVRLDKQVPIVREETFAPLLYVLPYDDFDEAI